MGNTLADVLVHVNENLDEEAMSSIEQDMRMKDGVVSVGRHPGQRHLLMVVYDSGITHAVSLLNPFRAQGLHAQVIGL